jgi:surfeit locus 1 family protein
METKAPPSLAEKICTLVMFLTLIGLGTWQVQRLTWKTALLAQIQSQMQKPPVLMDEKIDAAEWEWRRVLLAGHFLYDHEFLVKPRTLDGVNGYHMLVPFLRASGGIVMVDRGWISDELMPKANRPQGTIQLEGIAQQPHPGYFTPKNNPQKNDWYWPDVNAMAAAANLPPPAPVIVAIAARTPGVYPAGGKVQVNVRNDHLQYAIFWYTMAVILLGIFFVRTQGDDPRVAKIIQVMEDRIRGPREKVKALAVRIKERLSGLFKSGNT